MANVFDYLLWRGDLSFASAPISEVDSFILSKICCPDLTGLAPAPGEGERSFREVAADYFTARGDAPDKLGLLISDGILPMLRMAAETVRFENILLSNYVNRIDEGRDEQFCALTLRLPGGETVITFRGTDDTIAGWKENFNMSFLSAVPAQRDAVAYVTQLFSSGGEPLRICGHSKGGNLAVYAAMNCPETMQPRILRIENFDGPGFRQSALELPEYQRIRSRITTFVPQSSIIGMLLEHEEDYEVVKSRGTGPVQHDGLTWEVAGPAFVHLESTTGGSRYLDRMLKDWVHSVDDEARRAFTDALFGIVTSTGAKTLTELTEGKLKKTAAMIQSYRALDAGQRRMMKQCLKQFAHAAAQNAGRRDRA